MSIISPNKYKVKRKTFAKTIAKLAFPVYNKGTTKDKKAAGERQPK